MPYKINENHRACPARRPWAVVKKADGEVMGCHSSEANAQQQLGALYVDEPEASSAELRDAVGPHDTGAEGGEWDAAANTSRLPSPMSVDTARAVYAWYNSDAVEDGQISKEGGSLPHHFVDEDGNPGAASLNGVRNALSRLPQAEGLSDRQRETVEQHLNGHLPDDEGEENSHPPQGPQVVTRALPFQVDSADEDSDGLTLTGYAAVFNTPTRIDSLFEGTFDEVIAPGAFKQTLRGRKPVLQFDHGSHPMIGGLPLGRYEQLSEDEHGLFVRARLSGNWLIQPVRDAIRDGSITGMSFRFSVPEGKDAWDYSRDVPMRTVREVKLFEAGPVVFPAYEETSVDVRAQRMARDLNDPDFRAELARALLAGTPDAGAADGTPAPRAAESSEPQHALRGATQDDRHAVLRTVTLNSPDGGKS